MVKVDAKRDYYADLELPPTADAEEIKKQFRALGGHIVSNLSSMVLTWSSQTVSSRQKSRT